MTLDRFFFLDRRSIPWLDGLRALAIILVVLRHVFDRVFDRIFQPEVIVAFDNQFWIKLLAGYGWSGVYLFFIISGFLVGGSIILEIHSDTFRWRLFAVKRFFRVYIPAIVFLTAYALIPDDGLSGLIKPLDRFPQGDIFSSLGSWGIHNYLLIMNYTHDGLLDHYWSLAVEEHFYITLPIAALCLAPMIRRYPLHLVGRTFLVAALLFALFRLIVMQTSQLHDPLDYFRLSHWQFDFFAMGIALRLYYENRKSRLAASPPPSVPGIVLLLGLATLMALSLLAGVSEGNNLLRNQGNNDKIDGVLSFLNLCVMGALVFIASNIRAGILSSKGLRVIAAISFSTYIVHPYVIGRATFLYRLIQYDWNLTIIYLSVLAVGLAESLLGGLLFFIAVERPVLLLRDLIVKRWSRTPLDNAGCS